MVILQLKIAAFGKFKDREIPLRPGMNVITGDNESGKSTIAAFIRAMLFGFDEDSSEYARYLPYGFEGGTYGGSMRVLSDGLFYDVYRNLFAENKELRIVKQSDGRVVDDPDFWLLRALSGVSCERYMETGFMAQLSLQQDVDKWNNPSSGRDGAEELRIRNRYRRAEKVLEEKLEYYQGLEDPGAKAEYAELTASVEEKAERLESRREEQQKNSDKLTKMVTDLENDRKRVGIENVEHEEKLRTTMLETKAALQPLAEAGNVPKKKNVFGPVFLTVGLAVLVLTLYGMFSWQIFDSASRYFVPMVILYVLGGGLFAAGLILTILRARETERVNRAALEYARLKPQADDAETEYQRYMDNKEELEQKIDKLAFREETIDALRSRQEILDAELEKLEKELESLKEERDALGEKCAAQQSNDIEIRALKLAIESFEKLGMVRGAVESNVLENKATTYLNMLSRRKTDRIVIAADNTASVMTENGEISLSDLSMSAAQEVVLAIRLAGVEELDPNRTLPIVMDDVFAGFDTDSLNSCLNLLRTMSRQVILFSSQTRERRLL